MDKDNLRNQYLKIRKNVENKNDKSTIIANIVINLPEFKTSKIIATYKSLPQEVNTNEIIKQAIEEGKIIALPKVKQDKLEFYKYNPNKDNLIKSEFGVEEPEENVDNYIDKSKIDLIIVPGICFDKDKNRLGFGKGYYDRFLQNINAEKIGICFEEQIMISKSIPTEEHDIKMNKIISDKKIYN